MSDMLEWFDIIQLVAAGSSLTPEEHAVPSNLDEQDIKHSVILRQAL
jgi:hypothetical protein